MQVIGLDIGGANIKASDGEQRSVSRPFALWSEPENLTAALCDILNGFDAPHALAAAMTGELADCFATKQAGVDHIIDSLERAAAGAPIHLWQTGGEFVGTGDARDLTPLVAAANWHALATWAGRMAPDEAALLIDAGSTTCDVIPLENGIPMPLGRTDPERLRSGELVYTGVSRTPVFAIVDSLPLAGDDVPVAAEVFATTLDAYLLLGRIPENAYNTTTANNGPATASAAHDRIARMICADRTEVSLTQAREMAACIASRQLAKIASALERVLRRMTAAPSTTLISGEGEFLARDLIAANPILANSTIISLSQTLGPPHSQAACAFALARLGRERAFW